MPGPGPHLMYTLGVGIGLKRLSEGRFTPHHCLFYSLNALDLGSFSEWLTSTLATGEAAGSYAMYFLHHPFFYPLLLGLPFSVAYSWISRTLLRKGILTTIAGVPLNIVQCFYLLLAGSLSHFFLDHLFEENGYRRMLTWILSTGSWEGEPATVSSMVVVGLLSVILLGGYIYINRSKHPSTITSKRARHSMVLVGAIATVYCLWCASQLYWRQPAVGEEADLGVLIFLVVFFFLPHTLCVMCMHSSDIVSEYGRLPLVHKDIELHH